MQQQLHHHARGDRSRRRRRCVGPPPLRLLPLLLVLHACQPATALYHSSSQVLHWFSHCAAKRPDMMRFRELQERHTGTRMPIATISAGLQPQHHQAGAGPRPAAAAGKPKPAVLFVFGEHAREVITSEVGIWLARLLVDNTSSVYDWPELAAAFERARVDEHGHSTNVTASSSSSDTSAAAAASQTQQQSQPVKRDWPAITRTWVAQLLAQLEVVIIPIEALDSRRQVEAGELCVRKTASNVDLNRNWPYAWKQEAAEDEQYGGPGPLSEPQSKLLKHLLDHLTGRLLGYVNVHSGEWALYTPWDSKEAYGPGLPADLPDLVGKVGRTCDCKAGPAGAVSGYLAYGTSMDYAYVTKRVPYPLTVEVYGGGNIGRLGPGEANKPLDAWPVVDRAGAATTAAAALERRRTLLQQPAAVGPGSSSVAAWLRSLLPRLRGAPGNEQQQDEGQQQQQRRRRRLQQAGVDAEADAVAAAEADAVAAAEADAVAAAAAAAAAEVAPAGSGDVDGGAAAGGAAQEPPPVGGFTAGGGDLEQVRQQAAEQAMAAAAEGSGGSISLVTTPPHAPGQQQQLQAAGGASDAILATAAAAQPHVRGCFDAFNPTSEADYRRVVADWLAASLVMLKHMAEGPEGRRMAAHVAAAAALRGGALAGAPLGGSRHGGVVEGDAAAAAHDDVTNERGLLGTHC